MNGDKRILKEWLLYLSTLSFFQAAKVENTSLTGHSSGKTWTSILTVGRVDLYRRMGLMWYLSGMWDFCRVRVERCSPNTRSPLKHLLEPFLLYKSTQSTVDPVTYDLNMFKIIIIIVHSNNFSLKIATQSLWTVSNLCQEHCSCILTFQALHWRSTVTENLSRFKEHTDNNYWLLQKLVQNCPFSFNKSTAYSKLHTINKLLYNNIATVK